MEIGEINETLVAGGNGEGDDLNQLNFLTCIVVDQDVSLCVGLKQSSCDEMGKRCKRRGCCCWWTR
jgi:hypothetical protein